MDSDYVYCPILKGKQNDLRAMSLLNSVAKKLTIPLLEFPPVKPSESIENVTARFSKKVVQNIDRECYIDFPLIRETTIRGEPALDIAFGQLNAVGARFFPVFGFDRYEAGWGSVLKQAQRHGRLLLRLELEDVENSEDTIDRIRELQQQMAGGSIDVMIDCRYIGDPAFVANAAPSIADFFDSLSSRIGLLGRCFIAGSSAPKNVSAVPHDGMAQIVRNELSLWALLRSEKLPVTLTYADYGVIHPDFSDLLLATHINGKIRYTAGRHIYIFRGHSLRKEDKYEQYRELSRRVVRSGKYMSSNFSHGDRYIYDCASGLVGTGNPGTWVLVDQNHHVTLVANQIRRMSELATSGANSADILAVL